MEPRTLPAGEYRVKPGLTGAAVGGGVLSPNFVWAKAVALDMASTKLQGLFPVACADSARPPPLPSSRALMSSIHSLAFRPASTEHFGTAASTTILPTSMSTLKKMAAVLGARVFT